MGVRGFGFRVGGLEGRYPMPCDASVSKMSMICRMGPKMSIICRMGPKMSTIHWRGLKMSMVFRRGLEVSGNTVHRAMRALNFE